MTSMTQAQQALVEVFDRHVKAELAGDLETTMATMTDNPHLINVPVQMGGVGQAGVRNFYRNHLVGKFFPPDVEMINISRTVGHDQIAEEVFIRFTHTTCIEWMLPGVEPTNKTVEVGVVVIIKFEHNKIAHEHIYWDQASVLTQIGLLNPQGLPVNGPEGARKILELSGTAEKR